MVAAGENPDAEGKDGKETEYDGMEPPSDYEDIDDDEDTGGAKSKAKSKDKAADKEAPKATRAGKTKPNAVSHMNFRKLNIKNKNSRGRGRGGGRFGRR